MSRSLSRLDELRSRLDEINLQLLNLMSKRGAIVKEIGEIKKKQGVQKFDPVREREMLEQLVKHNTGPFDDETIRHLFKQIFKASLELQQDDHKKTLLVSRKDHPQDTVVMVGGRTCRQSPESRRGRSLFGGIGRAGPQSGRVAEAAGAAPACGAAPLNPGHRPTIFRGWEKKGLRILRRVADEFDLKVVSEIVNPADMELAVKYVDVIQIGARNMQNFELLKAAGSVRTPVFLKRGMSATVEELLFAAEYIVSRGNRQVILCERGIRTYEKWTRNTLDISAVPLLKQESHLPVFVDISHATGRRDILLPVAKAALAAGADGIMVEVHPEPAVALSDAHQQIDIPQFEKLISDLRQSGLLSESQDPASVASSGK